MEFSGLMEGQMDMRQEADNLKRLRQNFKNTPSVTFPEPIDGLIHKDVLVEEFIEGEPISQYIEMTEDDPIKRQLAATSLKAFLTMLIHHNFAHGAYLLLLTDLIIYII